MCCVTSTKPEAMGHDSDAFLLSPSENSYLPVNSPWKSPSKSSPALCIEPLSTATPPGPDTLSLHHYRKSLDCEHGFSSGLLDSTGQGRTEKTLRRKNAATNLTAQAQMGTVYQSQHQNAYYQPFSASSATSSSSPPPPLSPSYSPSALSDEELLAPLSPTVDGSGSGPGKQNYKLLVRSVSDRYPCFADPCRTLSAIVSRSFRTQ